MNEILTISVTIMLMVFSINLFLMIGLDLVGVNNVNDLQPAGLPTGLSYGGWSNTNINKNDLSIVSNDTNSSNIFTQLSEAGQSIPIIGDLIRYGLWLASIFLKITFYHITAMSLIGVPNPLIFVFSSIILVIQGLGIIGLLGYIKEVLRL